MSFIPGVSVEVAKNTLRAFTEMQYGVRLQLDAHDLAECVCVPELIRSTPSDAQNDEDEAGTSNAARISTDEEDGALDAAALIDHIRGSFSNGDSVLSILIRLIKSEQLNEEIQGDIVDLLGANNFELIEQILQNRCVISEEISEQFLRCKKLRRNLKDSAVIPLSDVSASRLVTGFTIQSDTDAKAQKRMAKQEKRIKKQLDKIVISLTDVEKLEYEVARRDLLRQKQQEEEDLRRATELSLTLSQSGMFAAKKKYPYVFDGMDASPMADVQVYGARFLLPEGTKRKNNYLYEEIAVPPTTSEKPLPADFEHVEVAKLDRIGKLCFDGFKRLNTVQSIVFEQAYNSLENLLICAPTGAGKTNIAMLTVLKTVRDHCLSSGEIDKNAFKIIYIAPMKALASEMTNSFAKRLSRIGLKVRELTGDTQLSKKEIAETQMLILTPEKWDVLTRKADDETLTQLIRLLIIDEVHLLHDDRGPVIEAIVSRTLRQMEVFHQNVRVVGLSATLPNYVDVAHFLRVNPERGLFFFDGRFRPVPLAQTFIGVHVGQSSNQERHRQLMDEACYEKCMGFLREDHQILVFVHSRNATTQLAKYFVEKAANANERILFLPSNVRSASYLQAVKSMKNAKSRELNELFQYGIGIHHAGLLRSDRNLMERLFADGHTRVLICTATLAWGVNLPAHAVIIRGTDIYNPQKGGFTDVGVLDVQQIFGRAGRPQYESFGHGVIITTESKITKYLAMLIRQAPIESQFQARILDNLNAEISRGTVTSIKEAVEWLRFTYFYIRLRKNPLAYGVNYAELKEDYELTKWLTELCHESARKLDRNRMVRFDSLNEYLSPTDLGRIASHFYINFDTVERFNDENGPVKLTSLITDDNILGLISLANEFTQIKARETEMEELQELASFGCVFPIKSGGLANCEGKVNCLLQCYVTRCFISNFALVSEAFYISQNASRIARALFEIVLRRGWAQATSACLKMSKAIQRRIWPFNSPLRQLQDINLLKESTVNKIEGRQLSLNRLWDMEAGELGSLLSCDGAKLYEAIRYIPVVDVEATIKPVTRTIMQIEAFCTPNFRWNDRFLGGGAQRFWVFVEDVDENIILHYEPLILKKKEVRLGVTQKLVFVIPLHDNQLDNRYQIRVAHDGLIVDDTIVPLSLHNCVLPHAMQAHTDLLDLDPLPVKALKNEKYESIYPFDYFNPIQTQVFFTLYATDDNTLIGAPTSSGKTLCAELAIFRLFNERPDKKCAYIAPLKALVRERITDWTRTFRERLGVSIVEVSGDHTPEISELNAASILVTTPEKWDGITRSADARQYVRNVELLIIDEIHLLGVERGAVLEAIVTRIKTMARRRALEKSPIRIIGLSTALANAGDVADWIDVKEHALYNFRPSVRPVPIQVHIQGFAGQHYCPRMALMNKPAFKAIKQFSPVKPSLVFVASRRQTRLTAMAFVSLLALEENPRQWLHVDEDELQAITSHVKDDNLKITLSFGIGIHHAGLQHHERSLVEKLFVERKIQVLIATATLAWGINVPAHLVIVKGTEFFDGKTHKYVDFPVTDVLQMIGRAGRPQYDTSAVAVVFVQDVKKNFYKRFLYEPFPVESSLMPVLPNHVNAEICAETISSKQEMLDYLTGTYLYRRLFANPSYYRIEDFSADGMTRFLSEIVDNCVLELLDSSCIAVDSETSEIEPTPLGRIASKYYLEHLTMRHFCERLKAGVELEELLRILSDCPEYEEIPVRHNEDNINQEMANYLPVKLAAGTDWESPHVKTNLLYQAHFSRMQIPVDYLTDQRSILESCIRIVQAMFDFCVAFGWLDTALNVIVLQQQIIQGRWYYDHPLMCLPHLSAHSIDGLAPLATVPQFQDQLGVYGQADVSERQNQQIVRKIMENSILERHEANELLKVLLRWPALRISDVRFQQGLNECSPKIRLFTAAKDEHYTPLLASTKYKLRVYLQLLNGSKNSLKVIASKYMKEKSAGWIVVLGERETKKIYAVQKVQSFDPKTYDKFVRLSFESPSMPGKYCFALYVMSDSYMGVDQEYNIFCDVSTSYSQQ